MDITKGINVLNVVQLMAKFKIQRTTNELKVGRWTFYTGVQINFDHSDPFMAHRQSNALVNMVRQHSN